MVIATWYVAATNAAALIGTDIDRLVVTNAKKV
jgi:hypothetical protein